MARKRVYQLARELNLSSKELIERAKALGYTGIQSHANTLEDNEARELKSKISAGAGRQDKSEKKTVLKRRVTRGRDGGGYELETIRLSPNGGKKVIERKEIKTEIPEISLPSFEISTPVVGEEAPVVATPADVPATSPSIETPAAPVEAAVDTPVVAPPVVEETPAAPVAVAETKEEAPAPVAVADTPEATTPAAPVEEVTPVEEVAPVAEAPAVVETKPEPAVVETKPEPPVEAKTEPVQTLATPAPSRPVAPPPKKKPKVKKQKEPAAPLIELKPNFEESNFNAFKPDDSGTVPKPKGPSTIDILETKTSGAIPMHEFREHNYKDIGRSRKPPRPTKSGGRDDQRSGGRNEQRGGRKPSRSVSSPGHRKKNKRNRGPKKSNAPVTAPMSEKKRVVKVDEAITIGDLAHRMGVKSAELIKKLLNRGTFATINQALSVEEATELAKQFDYDVQNVGFVEADILPQETTELDTPEMMESRPPVVTVMGHVDHGKTSLLDAIRGSDVAASEAGGITQHIGASVVHLKNNKGRLVFLDTPGHEAFTAMRSRGAQCTDIVILVVAADDGVMPQTIEAINHAKAAGVPIVVAVNKIDKAGANPQNARYALMQHDLVPEELGGDIQMFNVSAHTREGLDELLEGVLLLAEMSELQANPSKPASGIVVESKMEVGRGSVATILVAEGTLRRGDTLVVGTDFGRIRAMENDRQKTMQEAGPSIPVKVIGLSGTPEPGERFDVVADEKAAKQIIEHRRLQKQKEEQAAQRKRSSGLMWGVQESKKVNIILKADTQGTLEAIRQSLLQLQHDEIEVTIPHAAVGGITENDINLASTTESLVFGFHVRADNKAQRVAESEGVEIRIYRVIYKLIDAVKGIMEQQLAPTYEEKPIGSAEIRKIFNIPKAGRVAGCYVTEGKITRGALIRLYRENIQIYEGKVSTLRRFKDDVKEVAHGFECGIQIEGYQDIRDNDMIEAYEIKEVAQKLELN